MLQTERPAQAGLSSFGSFSSGKVHLAINFACEKFGESPYPLPDRLRFSRVLMDLPVTAQGESRLRSWHQKKQGLAVFACTRKAKTKHMPVSLWESLLGLPARTG